MRALIIGYGRAGRRHGATLDRLGIEWDYYDPYVSIGDAYYRKGGFISQNPANCLEVAIKIKYAFAIIATPPSLHLSQIQACLNVGLPVLCEKPLCALGQLGEAEAMLEHPLSHRVMMAQNYRFHPTLVAIKRSQELWEQLGGQWACFSDQHRTDIPEWGLLLDHVSHSVDILLWLSGMETLEVSRATHSSNASMETWFADGSMGSHSFNIWECVRTDMVNKKAWVSGPFGNVEVATSQPVAEQMMDAMYKVFLAHLTGNEGFPVGLEAGVRVQRVLEEAVRVANERE